MNKFTISLFLIILVLLIILAKFYLDEEKKIAPIRPDYSIASWPIYRGDSNLIGYTNSDLFDTLKLKWSYKTGRDIIASPIIGYGKIFIGSTDGNMYALNIFLFQINLYKVILICTQVSKISHNSSRTGNI